MYKSQSYSITAQERRGGTYLPSTSVVLHKGTYPKRGGTNTLHKSEFHDNTYVSNVSRPPSILKNSLTRHQGTSPQTQSIIYYVKQNGHAPNGDTHKPLLSSCDSENRTSMNGQHSLDLASSLNSTSSVSILKAPRLTNSSHHHSLHPNAQFDKAELADMNSNNNNTELTRSHGSGKSLRWKDLPAGSNEENTVIESDTDKFWKRCHSHTFIECQRQVQDTVSSPFCVCIRSFDDLPAADFGSKGSISKSKVYIWV